MNTRLLSLLMIGLTAFAATVAAQPVVNILTIDGAAAETAPGETPNTALARLTRSGSTAGPLTVSLRLRGLAINGTDYRLTSSGALLSTIPAGSASLDLIVTPIDDPFTEGTEDVRIDVQDPPQGSATSYIVGGEDRANITIMDNENPALPQRAIVSVATLDGLAVESPTGAVNTAVFRISRQLNTNGAVDVRYRLGGAAEAGTDYEALPGRITIPPGAIFADVVITPIDDSLIEDQETITLTLEPNDCPPATPQPPECYVLWGTTHASATLLSEDRPPPPVVTILSPTNGAVFTIPTNHIPVHFRAVDSNGYIAQYRVEASRFSSSRLITNVIASVSYPSAVPGTPVEVSLVWSNAPEGFHTLRVTVWDNTGDTATATLGVRVDPPPVIPITYEVIAVDDDAAETGPGEPPNPARFRVIRRGPPFDNNFDTVLNGSFFIPTSHGFGGTARENADFFVAYGSNIVTADAIEYEITIYPIDDYLVEGNESVRLQNCFIEVAMIYGVGAPIGVSCIDLVDTNGVPFPGITIRDNDPDPPIVPLVTIAATDPVASEVSPVLGTNDPGVFTVTRVGPTHSSIVVSYSFTTLPVVYPIRTTPLAMAINGVDYERLPGSVVIPAGATSAEIVVRPIYDLVGERTEYVQLTLRPSLIPPPQAGSYVIDRNVAATINILNFAHTNVPVVSISAPDPDAIEENVSRRTGRFLVSRSGNTNAAITVPYAIGGSASNGVDYVALPGFVTIPAASRGVSITINPINDPIPERGEGVSLTLLPPPTNSFPPPYLLGQQRSAGVSIRDRLRRSQVDRQLGGLVVVPLPVPPPPGETNTVSPCWVIECSTNLTDWDAVGISSETDPSEEVDLYMDVSAAEAPIRFYRVRPCIAPDPAAP